MDSLIREFMSEVGKGKIEIYNEFSLQHELGVYLRGRLPQLRIQFERNVRFFFIAPESFPKREIDICAWSLSTGSARIPEWAIELKFPRAGRHPESMYDYIKDISFCEKLREQGFKQAYAVMVADDPLFYRTSRASGIYAHFRSGHPLMGHIVKPTGNQDHTTTLRGKYELSWQAVSPDISFLIVAAQ